MKALRIAFLTPWDISDENSWSGVINPMYRALAQHADVVAAETGNIKMSQVDRLLLATLGRVSDKPYLSGHALATSVKRGKIVARLIRQTKADVVLCVAASQDIAFAEVDQHVVQVTDATFNAMTGYYPLFSNLHTLSAWQGGYLSKRSQAKTTAFSVASDWAKSALEKSGARPDSCRVIPFGPSMQPPSPVRRQCGKGLRVLVVARDWQRKGGDLAVAAVASFRVQHPNTTLTVVGDAPHLPGWVTNLGRVPREAMPSVYAEHDVLLELAEANAGGVTLTDAHAFGLPVVATDTGGVRSIVADGVSGILIDRTKNLELQVRTALEELSDSAFYQNMVNGSNERHRSLLNWDTWALETTRLCKDIFRG
ncbi:glycosyltransferase family 4 protein [Pseudarthrobacter sp. C1]|uniref:glycosyltransferase family 4 protein n=1 Tax=Pseudarthrobacter sp. C1 TaxID=3108940 RepID=UPI002B052486|nr:glycosyltransferase family 4 protein [Pseudarthrobacter sp. C1]MEA3550266.1 glycosyltransferase family 4 protein [Pseudarthrobacter sp. C1]